MKTKTILILVIVAAAVFAAYQWLKLQPVKEANKAIQDGGMVNIDVEGLSNGNDLGVVTLVDNKVSADNEKTPTLADIETGVYGVNEVIPLNLRGQVAVFWNLVALRRNQTVDMNRIDQWQGDPVTFGVIREMMKGYPDLVYQAANYKL